MRRLSRKRLYWRLAIIVVVLLIVRLSVVVLHHRFPFSYINASVTVPYLNLRVGLDHGSVGVRIQFSDYYEGFKVQNWTRGGPFTSYGDLSVLLPAEVWALAFMLAFLALFRTWRLFFYPDRGELVEDARKA